jgi:hypothetical protein
MSVRRQARLPNKSFEADGYAKQKQGSECTLIGPGR